MLLAFGVLILVIIGLGVGGILVGVAPLIVVPVAALLVIGASAVYIRIQNARLAVEREREGIEFTEEDYDTLAHRPEHTHGSVKRRPRRPTT
jgi:hypothetical protein